MQTQVNIEFDQLVKLVKGLPIKQWTELKNKVENRQGQQKNSELESFLLTAPTFSKKQLTEMAKTRIAMNTWRTN